MIKFIDLFAGMGGTRLGFETACKELGIEAKCVFTSEIKPPAIKIYKHNFQTNKINGDITNISEDNIPDFDYLLAGFPCQPFSTAGNQHGFQDTRGTLFFDIARIIKHKRPQGFLLENVAGLVSHDKTNKNDKIGRTLSIIISTLEVMGYKVSWKVLDAQNFGVAQKRERIYIVGNLSYKPHLDNFAKKHSKLTDILETNLSCENTLFRDKLLSLYTKEQLYGKAIKDKRGGANNIHSWDLELKGTVSKLQKELMSLLLKNRRQKHWAAKKRITWMDGMPLTLDEISTFFYSVTKLKLKQMLDDLVEKKYLVFEHPKELYTYDNGTNYRKQDTSKAKGYNIVTGKLSFELNKILHPEEISNTLVATEVSRIGIIDKGGIRTLSNRECLRLSGFPETYKININSNELYDLIGNTVVVPVIEAVSKRIIRDNIIPILHENLSSAQYEMVI